MAVEVLELGGYELDVVNLHALKCRLGQFLHLHEPLGGELWLDDGIGALAVAHLVDVVLDAFHQSGGLEVGHDFLAHDEAVLADVHAPGRGDSAVGVEDVDAWQVVLQAQVVVVDVVRRGHLQATRAEVHLHVLVLDDGHLAAHQRHDHFLAAQPVVALVVGVDAHGRVAQDGFGARGGNHDVALIGVVGHVVAEVEQMALFFLVYDFLVAEGGEGLGVPVDHAGAAVDVALVVEGVEDLYHACREDRVHGEGRARPVAAGAQLLQLFENDAAVSVRPVPGVLEEFLSREGVLVDALGG